MDNYFLTYVGPIMILVTSYGYLRSKNNKIENLFLTVLIFSIAGPIIGYIVNSLLPGGEGNIFNFTDLSGNRFLAAIQMVLGIIFWSLLFSLFSVVLYSGHAITAGILILPLTLIKPSKLNKFQKRILWSISGAIAGGMSMIIWSWGLPDFSLLIIGIIPGVLCSLISLKYQKTIS